MTWRLDPTHNVTLSGLQQRGSATSISALCVLFSTLGHAADILFSPSCSPFPLLPPLGRYYLSELSSFPPSSVMTSTLTMGKLSSSLPPSDIGSHFPPHSPSREEQWPQPGCKHSAHDFKRLSFNGLHCFFIIYCSQKSLILLIT